MKIKNLFYLSFAATIALTACGGDEDVTATGLTLDKATIELAAGETAQLTATLEPKGATGKLQWKSSDITVAEVTATDNVATVKALKAGTATISAILDNGVASKQCVVTVTGSTTTGGNGTEASPYSVEEAMDNYSDGAASNVWIKGYIVGNVDGEGMSISSESKFEAPYTVASNILIAADKGETDYSKCIPVQLPAGAVRTGLNLVDNAANDSKEVLLYGSLEKYFGVAGIKSTSYYELEGGTTGGTKPGGSTETGNGNGTESSPYDVAAAKGKFVDGVAVNVWLQAYIVGVVDDGAGGGMTISSQSKFAAPYTNKANVLVADNASETDYSKCIPVQLPAGAMRDGLNLVDNGSNQGKKVKIYGSLEKYFGVAGLKTPSYYELEGGTTGGTKPADTGGAVLNETLLTQASFDKFTTHSVAGDAVWTFKSTYGAAMSGYDEASNSSAANEDWFITPALDMTGKQGQISFDHARGPAGSITVGVTEGWYKVFVSNDYSSGDPNAATWTEITGVTHGTTAWGYVQGGPVNIPSANLKANCRVAFKYVCDNTNSATWEIKNLVIK
jgi:hypothetical protein